MNKKEFMDTLRQALEGEVASNVIEQSTSFYNEYISSQPGKTEDEVIKEIGDPRLIAKTIIESEKAAYGEADRQDKYDTNRSSYNDYSQRNDNRSSPNNNRVYHLKWYHIAIIAVIILFIFFLLIRIGWVLLRLLSTFFLPIAFIVLIWALFRKR